jgi:hypothetical protein
MHAIKIKNKNAKLVAELFQAALRSAVMHAIFCTT